MSKGWGKYNTQCDWIEREARYQWAVDMYATDVKIDLKKKKVWVHLLENNVIQSKIILVGSCTRKALKRPWHLLGLVSNQCRNFFLNILYEFSLNISSGEILFDLVVIILLDVHLDSITEAYLCCPRPKSMKLSLFLINSCSVF